VSTIQSFVLVPLTYVGGVFCPLASLPGWARQPSLANPILHMVNAVRYGLLGMSDVPAALAFALLCAAAVVLLLAAVVLMACGRGVRAD
jgi:ABC-2 type transport system permease protein